MKISNTFLNGYFKQKTAESGRSMVEILGVLAVMGVLSAGGIYGYTFAMDKYRANDIVYEVNLRANDVWHKYQEQPLPDPSEDGTDFDEFPDMTGTGYPIYMTSHPDIAFKTYVEGVSSRVCKNVVNMNLNGVVKGIQFVQVAQGEGDLVKYTGNASICGEDETDNLIVFTSFLDAESNEAGEGQSGDPCVDDEDCGNLCAPVTCENDMTCHNRCTGTTNPFCFDDDKGGICVECLTNKDCPNEQICDLTNHKCVDIPKTCGEGGRFGKEYRAANGTCVPCDYMSEIIIMNSDDNDGIFEKQVGGVSIKDTHSGIEMCQACASIQHRIEEAGRDDNIKTYCATSCVKGNSFLNRGGTCVKCSADSDQGIPDDDKARLLCDACPNRISVGGDYRGWHCARQTCPNGWYKVRDARCVKCDKSNINDWTTATDFHGGYFWANAYTSSREIIEEWSRLCEACATSTDEKLRSKRHVLELNGDYFCVKKCEDNQFQTPDGSCLDCTDPYSYSLTGTGGNGAKLVYLKGLCTSEKCGRIYKDGYCILPADRQCEHEKTETTGNQFLGQDMQCYSCTTSGYVKVDSKEDCENACPTTRKYYDGYCYKNCVDNELHVQGTCQSCSVIGDGILLMYNSWNIHTQHDTDDCNNRCKDENNQPKYMYHLYADNIHCVPRTCSTGKLRNAYGNCQACLKSGSVLVNNYKTECEKCPNHMYINKYCVYYNPGQSGVCNSDSPDTTKYPNLPVGSKYRDVTGICRSCTDTQNGFSSTAEECASCGGLRTLIDGKCMYGGCIQNNTFMSTTGCPSCDVTGAVAIPDKSEAEQLCNDCNRRVMSTVNDAKYCVPICDSGEWQDINGDCWGSEIDVGNNEIGTDELSAQLCRNASRSPSKDDETGRVYCQQ